MTTTTATAPNEQGHRTASAGTEAGTQAGADRANAVEARGIVKHFGATKALDGVDLTVRQGTVLGVLGPNGAGKTTLIRVLSTLIKPDAGSAVVGGYDVLRQPKQLRRTIGLTGQYASVDEYLSGSENLYLIGRLLDLSRKDAKARAAELLERFSLTEAAGRPAKTYSGGMRRRLDLAASMIGRPRVLYLDEPTTGLDPRTRNEVWEEVRRMVADGSTVLLTTQYMEEAEQLATDLTVIDRGKVIANGTVDGLKAQVGGRTLRVRPTRPEELAEMVHCLTGAGIAGAVALPQDGLLTVPISDEAQLTTVIGVLGTRGFGIAGIDTEVPSLDEVFLAITGKTTTGTTTATGTPGDSTAATEETQR
ncbi:ATP-binding cassette domain-containing protein [Kitasatospora sp. NBC_01287]|uniref:ATP-binding cassette domain-containing protein n=1 Tax=Kitasatospora sp. NBC_01287 TaxID=2903573 RepID=UPI00224F5509|nr:ATP-binding cassette domain-containing protein [Kitasatospora sp. NBC_01287]MCX4749449.1 ATP-binding cassette domain-containing protein [Kitasatospora sp. NBC_01287]